jgi:endonuclease/exonuclease/phosphatase (EEP) superfamily protein YafD
VTSIKSTGPANQDKALHNAKKRQHRDWSGATLGLALGVFGLILARLGHLWIGFDVFAQFSMQFIFLGFSMAMGLVFPRYKGLAGSVLFVVMISAYSLWPHYNRGTTVVTAAAGEQVLRVASFNTYYDNHDTNGITTEILALDADVIALIEFGREKQATLDALRRIYPYQTECFSLPNCDQAIISKLPLANEQARSNWAGPDYVRATLGPQYGSVTIMAIHTTRFPHSRAQLKQIRALIGYGENIPGRMIMMGDFNATPFSRITQTLSENLGLKRLTNLPTWPATYGFAQLAIDHIFVSQDIRALDSQRIGNNVGSDHFPIAITLAVPQK